MIIANIGLLAGISESGRTPLRGSEMSQLHTLSGAWLRVLGGCFHSWGTMDRFPITDGAEEIVDAAGGMVLPSFCDSHTHIVYAGSREQEFVDKIHGLSYEEIARRGGGILNSADLLRATSEDELFRQSMERVDEAMRMGTGCLEIKSGYGLNVESELKMLRVIARIADASPVNIRSTFLGAHAVGREYAGNPEGYVDMLVSQMLPAVAAEGLASYVDVFCDTGFFTVDQTARILEAAARYGMRPKIHADELGLSGGTRVGVAHGALSVDHLERISDDEIRLLAASSTVATLLPGASFFLGMPYGPGRRLVDGGAIVALASDYNPGSSPSGNMRMVMSLGCIKMKFTPEEAFNAVTVNGAAAMDCLDQYGSITPGKVANFLLTRPVPSFAFMSYAYTTPFIRGLWLRGSRID